MRHLVRTLRWFVVPVVALVILLGVSLSPAATPTANAQGGGYTYYQWPNNYSYYYYYGYYTYYSPYYNYYPSYFGARYTWY